MAVYGGPDIVTDGLVLHLDAANLRSYFGYWSPYLSNGANAFDGDLTTAAGILGGTTGPFTYNFVHPRSIASARIYVTFGATISQVGSATNIFLVNGIDVTQKVKNAGFYLTSGWIDITDEAGPVLNSLQFKTVGAVTNAGIYAIEINGKILTGNYDGTIWNDLSGNENNGTFFNGVAYGNDNYGVMSFDGANDYVITSRPSSITTGGNMSICMYAKWNTKTWTGNYSTGLQALIDNNHDNTNGFVIQDRPDLTNAPLNATGGLVSTFKVGDGNWHFIAITLLGTTESKMYIDGILNVSNTGFGIGPVQPNISIGYWQRSPSRYFNGLIPQVLIYNRALSSSEIRQNFEAVKGRYGL